MATLDWLVMILFLAGLIGTELTLSKRNVSY